MQEKHLFEYAVLRYVPRVEREEFFNIGVVLFCASENFLEVKFELDCKRLGSMYDKIDIEELQMRLQAFSSICEGDAHSGPIGKLPVASRFRWLTSKRSTILQISAVHPGLCDDATEMLGRLFSQLVE